MLSFIMKQHMDALSSHMCTLYMLGLSGLTSEVDLELQLMVINLRSLVALTSTTYLCM